MNLKLSKETFDIDDVMSLAWGYRNSYHPEWRYGQTIFNICASNFPEEAGELVGTNKDCFYYDDNILAFLKALDKRLKG